MIDNMHPSSTAEFANKRRDLAPAAEGLATDVVERRRALMNELQMSLKSKEIMRLGRFSNVC
ncbi:MAG TPA: hypothetical protein VK192_08890 [Sphingomicrobium sp.]|jgi:hypothetical protein|nr:hypothetical protein [Sphingomicrobium sp.]